MLDFIKDYLESLIQYPKVAITFLILGGVAGFFISQYISSSEIKEKDERIKLRDDRISSLESSNNQLRVQLGIDQQKPTRFQLLSNKDLKSAALTTANKINDLGLRFRRATGSDTVSTPKPDNAKVIRNAEAILNEYSRDYATNATLLYIEMKNRGATYSRMREYTEYTISNPTNGFGIADVATTLREMATSLPD